ncbi:MAG: phospho-sugar mutase, partial [Deltaproteobacteria bacterium]|nr:phospho-sugar mutase [Deltaproteobacteria bacterium]
MTASLAELVARARAYAEDDPDPATRAELIALADAGDAAGLRAALEPALRFGTAGLRGIVGPGPARMNRAVVIRTARALAEELLARNVDGRTLPVVVGRDARLPGRELLEAVAGTLAAAGVPVRYFPEPVPTPLVAFAVRALSAQAGVVVTASHNPADYEGMKVYGAEGIQIVPPVDAEIEARAAALPGALRIPVSKDALAGGDPRVTEVPPSLVARYLDQVEALRPPGGPADRSLKIVHTSLHG